MPTVASSSTAYTAIAPPLRRITPVTPVAYESEARPKKRLNQLKNPPNTRFMPRVSQSGLSWCPLSSRADSAGDRVRELNAEITVEMAIVMANCLENWPDNPVMKEHGPNHHTRVRAVARKVTLKSRRRRGRRPPGGGRAP